MYIIKQTEQFTIWLDGLKDNQTKLRLAKRLRKAELGNLGDIKSVGNSVFEMREVFGPGWRMYYIMQNGVLIIMLGGGDKATQKSDIVQAIEIAKQLEDERND